ncbi:hypothetical protein DFQ28_011321 [Apophysomyces sp. BC1034]|nr:hypothetical protein DFQ30_011037 [Apophysomyces sp. BC1015]KAG0172203.1 hypothetical protein DFQ29_008483 [Apophysomyces sp. BC1021]KAG0184357.1 hypothetical protein DFQ28_011321 [Apophysomyces sp. BC1034]
MNKAIFHTKDLSQAYGRKVDLILKCASNVKVDISSNKWKKAAVSKAIKLHQQSKNLRSNTSNLFSLNTNYDVKSTIAMDFMGNSGYLYDLQILDHNADLHDCIAVAHLVTHLVIHTSIESLDTLEDTLRGLITLKDHLVNISRKVKTKPNELRHAAILENICSMPSADTYHLKLSYIFFATKNNRVRKRKLLELDDDDDDDEDL